jgi:diadenosine tetraphosphate (Ap4A) HIT family hydrolase
MHLPYSLFTKVVKAMKKVLTEISGNGVQGIYVCSFNGCKDFPVHFHLVPRYESDKLMGDELLFERSKRKLVISQKDSNALVRVMKKELLRT